MDGPNDGLRADIIAELGPTRRTDFAGTDLDAEGVLLNVLARIELGALEDVAVSRYRDGAEMSTDEGWDLLAGIEAWAGLASAAVGQVYAPASPWPRSTSGWGKKAIAALQRVVKVLLTPLQVAAKALGASSWSVGVGFPWGLSISLSWP
jgi:hypothetical protein